MPLPPHLRPLESDLHRFLEQETRNPVHGHAAKKLLGAISNNKKEASTMKKSQLKARLAQVEKQLNGRVYKGGVNPAAANDVFASVVRGVPSLQQVELAMKAAATEADRQGDAQKAREIRNELAVLKMQIAERARQLRPSPGPMGPGSVELFARTGTLGDDPSVEGI